MRLVLLVLIFHALDIEGFLLDIQGFFLHGVQRDNYGTDGTNEAEYEAELRSNYFPGQATQPGDGSEYVGDVFVFHITQMEELIIGRRCRGGV